MFSRNIDVFSIKAVNRVSFSVITQMKYYVETKVIRFNYIFPLSNYTMTLFCMVY